MTKPYAEKSREILLVESLLQVGSALQVMKSEIKDQQLLSDLIESTHFLVEQSLRSIYGEEGLRSLLQSMQRPLDVIEDMLKDTFKKSGSPEN